MIFGLGRSTQMVTPDEALPGRPDPLPGIPDRHEVLGTSMHGPWPDGTEVMYVAMGCFWGAERIFWQQPGVVATAAGYMGGYTPNPTYEETCTGRTGHTEAVLVAYDPSQTDPETLLKAFWENHDPTTANRQGNDVGTQYRSALYTLSEGQDATARELTRVYGDELARRDLGEITTEIKPAPTYYYAEDAHQQYLAKNPFGYRCHANTGVKFPATA